MISRKRRCGLIHLVLWALIYRLRLLISHFDDTPSIAVAWSPSPSRLATISSSRITRATNQYVSNKLLRPSVRQRPRTSLSSSSSRPSRPVEMGRSGKDKKSSTDKGSSSPKKERKDQSQEKEESDNDDGFFRGWFRRGKDGEDTAQESKKSKGKVTKKSKDTTTPKDDAENGNIFSRVQSIFSKDGEKLQNATKTESTSESNVFGRIQGFFARNATDDNTTESSNASTTLNPLSVMQKWLERPVPEEWVTVFPKTRIMPGQMVPVTVAGLDLLVIASRDGRRLYCIANSCPHLGTPLETGTLVRLPRAESSSSTFSTGVPPSSVFTTNPLKFTETDVSNLLSQDGCEDCVVCPLHRTAFALESGDVRGEWCPYPPVLGKMMGTVKKPTGAAVFDVRTRGKNVQVRINTPLVEVR